MTIASIMVIKTKADIVTAKPLLLRSMAYYSLYSPVKGSAHVWPHLWLYPQHFACPEQSASNIHVGGHASSFTSLNITAVVLTGGQRPSFSSKKEENTKKTS